jgi:hypothetical protein
VCRARLGRPIGLPACAALGRPMPPLLQRSSNSLEDANTANPTMLTNGVEGVKLMDAKDSEKHADNPSKAPGERASGLFGGEDPPAPDNYGGQTRGAYSPAPGGPMKGSSPEARVR